MSGPAFEPTQRPSSASTLIDPRGDHLTAEECDAVLGLLKLSGCSPGQMRAAEIELGQQYGYPLVSQGATPPAPTVNPGMSPVMGTPEGSESSSDSTLEDVNPLFAEERFCRTPPNSPGTASAASINLGMRNMAIHPLENTPPDSDSSGNMMKYPPSYSPGNGGSSSPLDGPTNDVRMTDSSPKISTSSPKSQNKVTIRKSVGMVAAQPVLQPTRRSTRQRKESRRLIEARESEKLGAC
ncbi:uncharacterized protein BDCG_00625 [Blastomyces dermatitidis ER-3]|uniref:Uncharacterized protein n=1 Tax=Ajellomyces dermatitidis (strain ER-3 / ATCC MYA-2586) TaxID=559297 RepID=A0ABP2ELR3_AJEDR|nr:uncharacterized protein BDCG_00625 [Blastomyces dermatitidis ER-3]EEQ83820.1 hypothetical protein BDCG_00625 [Blastomyces dermatitidis ER-3]